MNRLPNKTSFKIGSKPWNKGKKMSIEARRKMSETRILNIQLGITKIWCKGTKGVMKAWNKGKNFTPDVCKKMSNSAFIRFSNKKNHPRWVEDRNNLASGRGKAYDTKYKYWMLEVKKRDKWKCRVADNKCNGRLEAHHILGWRSHPELRYKLNNGITLCHAHHPRKRIDEVKLSSYFQKLVAEMK